MRKPDGETVESAGEEQRYRRAEMSAEPQLREIANGEGADEAYSVNVLLRPKSVLNHTDGDFYICCRGNIMPVPPETVTLSKAFAVVYLHRDEELVAEPYDQPMALGLNDNGQIVLPRHFHFFGSNHPAGDEEPRLLTLPQSPNDEPVQYLYVWAKLSSGVWAKPALIRLSLEVKGETDCGDREP